MPLPQPTRALRLLRAAPAGRTETSLPRPGQPFVRGAPPCLPGRGALPSRVRLPLPLPPREQPPLPPPQPQPRSLCCSASGGPERSGLGWAGPGQGDAEGRPRAGGRGQRSRLMLGACRRRSPCREPAPPPPGARRSRCATPRPCWPSPCPPCPRAAPPTRCPPPTARAAAARGKASTAQVSAPRHVCAGTKELGWGEPRNEVGEKFARARPPSFSLLAGASPPPPPAEPLSLHAALHPKEGGG